MSITELATEQNVANGFVRSSEESDIQTGSPLPNGGADQIGD